MPPLDPGASVTVRVAPVSESGIYVVDPATADTLGGCCYIEPGYGGRVRFDVRGGTATVVDRRSGILGLGP